MSTIVYPSQYRILECKSGRWSIKNVEPFSSYKDSTDYNDTASIFGITEQAVVVELFRLNNGKSGYYLANLKDRKYHYCGLTLEHVKATLLGLGIGRVSPVES